ncbi:MAG: TlpA disulfide reductase family protein [Bacteroidia bacterium]
MRSKLTAIFIFLFMVTSAFSHKLKEGTYRAVLTLDEKENIELPFNFDLVYKKKKPNIIIRNGDERISVDEIKIKGDSVVIKMPVFDTEFRCIMKGDNLDGVWINHYRKEKNVIKFSATFGETMRFNVVPGKANPYFEGKWEVTFSPNTKDSSKAIGVFHHIEQTDYLTGTFLTETGDYRFLEGIKHGDKLYLSCFDGSHAFLFIAQMYEGTTLKGMFYSGSHHSEPWIAVQNPEFKLRKSDEITFLTKKDEKINLTFPDLHKKTISLDDRQFANKPVILQIMGSWCPNCMDESVYLNSVYNKYKGEGLEVVALAFEKTTDEKKVNQQVQRMADRLKINYTILLTLKSGKDKASESLNFVNKIVAFPTTIFLNKEHKVVKIHTGFNGPATGNEFVLFQEEIETLVKQLVKE